MSSKVVDETLKEDLITNLIINLNTSLILNILQNDMTKSANIMAKHIKWSRAVGQPMGKTCAYCQEQNHYAVKCPKKNRRVQQVHDEQSQDASEASNDEWVDALTSGSRKDVKCRMLMPDKSDVIFQVDTAYRIICKCAT